jgi:arylsulfatase A-like enzyme
MVGPAFGTSRLVEAVSDPPNLLLFMPDQLRADCVGAFGNDVVHTPAIDALAARGVRFTNTYSQHSVCAQSRISMFTGLYPHVNGHRSLEYLLAPDEPNIFAACSRPGITSRWQAHAVTCSAPA